MAVDAKRVQAVFLTVVEAEDASQRAAILDRECTGDGELRRRVEALLQAHVAPASILQRPAVSPIEADRPPSQGTHALDASNQQAAPRQGPVTTDDGPRGDESAAALAFLQPSTKPGALGRLGHYEVLEVLGQGGFGVVVRAFDEKLQRVVAIKIMSAQLASVSPARKRFLREARAAAKVRHENVVQIYAVEEQPIPFLVMEYIPGRTLQQKLDDHGPLDHPEMLRLAVQIAHGLAAAHAQGLIHRDVKPSNILLDEGIEPRVKITDFGLARTADDASLTQSGVVAGTPMYMAPEQAAGKTLDQRADLFSLGSVFYVMLSGRPPFRASGTMAVLKRVCEDTPRPIREIIPEVPAWLEGAIGTLHAKKPDERFQTAAAVAELLSQYLAHQQPPASLPLPASIPSANPRREPRARRLPLGLRRGLAGKLLVPTGLLLGIVATLTTVLMLRRDSAGRPDARAVVQGTDEVFDALQRDQIPPALLALAGGGALDQAPPELVALLGDGRFILPGAGSGCWMAVSPDGKTLAATQGNSIVLFDAETGALLRNLAGHTAAVVSVALSPDGTRLASASEDRSVRVWETATGQQAHVLNGHTDAIYRVAFSPDGARIASASNDKTIRVWAARSGELQLTITGPTVALHTVCFTPDSTHIVSSNFANLLEIWDAADGKKLLEREGHTSLIQTTAFSPDRTLLATGSGKELILWDAKTFDKIHTESVQATSLGFSPDSRTLLLADRPTRPDLAPFATRWDVATRKVLTTLPLKINSTSLFCQLSPDGKVLFTRGGDGKQDRNVRAYDAETGKELFPQQGHEGPVWSVAISPDGRTLASGGDDHTVKLWDLGRWKAADALPPVRTLTGHQGTVQSVAFSPDGKLLASGSTDGTVALWDFARGAEVHNLRGTSLVPLRLAFSPDGRALAVGGEDGSVRLLDVTTWKEDPAPLRWHTARVRSVAFSADGTWLASAGDDARVCLCDVAKGRLAWSAAMAPGTVISNVAFSADGRMLAALSNGWPDRGLHVWDLATRKETTEADLIPPGLEGPGLAFSPTGPLLAVGSWYGTVSFVDRTGAAPRDRMIGPGPFGVNAHAVAFSPQGRYLVVAGANGIIAILRVPLPPPDGVDQELPPPAK